MNQAAEDIQTGPRPPYGPSPLCEAVKSLRDLRLYLESCAARMQQEARYEQKRMGFLRDD